MTDRLTMPVAKPPADLPPTATRLSDSRRAEDILEKDMQLEISIYQLDLLWTGWYRRLRVERLISTNADLLWTGRYRRVREPNQEMGSTNTLRFLALLVGRILLMGARSCLSAPPRRGCAGRTPDAGRRTGNERRGRAHGRTSNAQISFCHPHAHLLHSLPS